MTLDKQKQYPLRFLADLLYKGNFQPKLLESLR